VHFPNLNGYNFVAMVTMNLKLTMIILWSFCYSHWEFQAPPISCVGVTSTHTTHGWKLAVLYLWFDAHRFWQKAIYSFKRGIVKQKAWCAHKPGIKSEALTALVW